MKGIVAVLFLLFFAAAPESFGSSGEKGSPSAKLEGGFGGFGVKCSTSLRVQPFLLPPVWCVGFGWGKIVYSNSTRKDPFSQGNRIILISKEYSSLLEVRAQNDRGWFSKGEIQPKDL